MDGMVKWVGPNRALEILGVRLVGIDAENGKKLLMTLLLVGLVYLLRWILRWLAGFILRLRPNEKAEFWLRQATRLLTGFLLLLGLASIWFDDPGRLATALGLITAGLAFALQRVVTAIAGYFVILRGQTFHIGDRIVMGGVRGDVVELGLMQTTIMEMGQPPSVQSADPAMWVRGREYTGRLVTVTNAKIFDEPVYNYTHHFPYIWDEIRLPVHYTDDHGRAEAILLAAARKHALTPDKVPADKLAELDRLYGLKHLDIAPRVFWRLTDNWLEMAVRFLAPDHGTRAIKDAMSRDVLAGLSAAGMSVASSTQEITLVPPPRQGPA